MDRNKKSVMPAVMRAGYKNIKKYDRQQFERSCTDLYGRGRGGHERDRRMIEEKSWSEFRKTGLLWFINQILHLFGWVIVIAYGDGTGTSEDGTEITRVFPARTRYRGFSEAVNTEGYGKVTRYLQENIDELSEEARDGQE